MKITVLSILLTVAFLGDLWAQEAEKATFPRTSLKVNINYRKALKTKNFTLGNVAPVLMLTNKRQNVHEIELNAFGGNQLKEYSFTGAVINVRKKFELAFRYQYDWRILKKETGIDPYLGLSLLSGFSRTKTEPQLISAYEGTVTGFDHTLSLVPGIRYSLPRSFFLDLNIPVDFLTLLTQYQWVRNPNLPLRQQRYWRTDLGSYPEIFQQIHLRLGAGVRF